MNINKKWLTNEEAMNYLGCKRTKLYYLRKKNLIKWAKQGRHIYILAQSIIEMLDKNSSDFLTKNINLR